MQLTLLQRQICEQILGLYDRNKPVKVDFKAHTESWKTLMVSFIIFALVERETTEKFIFVIATPSSSSNISGEYLDDDKSVRRSFFDFVVKFNCSACLYIEVKDKNNINPDKTKQLKVAYTDYFEKQGQKSLFEEPLAISVWQVNNKNSITYETFYDKNKIDKNLNALAIENLLKTISDLKLNAVVN